MERFDIVVIGAGPGGYVAAIRAAQLGMKTACVEKESALGGTCLRVGCIPSKAMLESSERFHEAASALAEHGVRVSDVRLDLPAMLARKDAIVKGLTDGVEYLFRKHGVTRLHGHARLQGGGRVHIQEEDGERVLESPRIIIAAGSVPAGLPGVEMDWRLIGTSTEALSYTEVPQTLVVIGAGYVGLELGSVWNRLGSQVTVLEFMPRILPGMDSELAAEAEKIFRRQGLDIRTGARVTKASVRDGRCVLECEGMEPITADRVLVSAGRRPNTEGLGLEEAGVQVTDRGFIRVDEAFQTTAPGVYAIGDVIGGAMLAHKAEDEGIACVERLATGYGHVDYTCIPGIVYTQPELASVGRTEDQLQQDGVDYRKGVFPFSANGRARALGDTSGRVKVLAGARTDRVLGVHIIGPRAGDIIAEAAAAMAFGASSEDIARTCHAHPTLSEALREAALAVDGRAIHV